MSTKATTFDEPVTLYMVTEGQELIEAKAVGQAPSCLGSPHYILEGDPDPRILIGPGGEPKFEWSLTREGAIEKRQRALLKEYGDLCQQTKACARKLLQVINMARKERGLQPLRGELSR